MSKLHKIIFLFLTLFIYQADLFAETAAVPSDSGAGIYVDTNVNLATGSECMLDVGSIVAIGVGITTGITGSISGLAEIISGNALLAAPDPTTITKIKGTLLIASGTISIAAAIAKLTYVAIGGVGFGVCAGSFVRDPMKYFPKTSLPDGESMFPKLWEGQMMKEIKNPNGLTSYKPVASETAYGIDCTKDEKDCYFLGKSDSRADKIVVCARGIVPIGVFSMEGCYKGGTRRGWITGVGGDVFSGGKDNDYYDGSKSLLCPEEFRQVWRGPKKDKEPSGFKKLGCNKGDLKKCTSDEEKYSINPNYKKNSSLENYKLTFGRPECHERVKKNGKWDPIYINGYKYTIAQNGINLCATLVGLGELPWVQKYKIGCIKSRTSNAMPRCAKSKPIYENHTLNSDGMIDFYGDSAGGTNLVLRYDDTPCGNACSLSALCQSVGGMKVLNAPIPITSYLMGCFRESLNQITYGCSSVTAGTGSSQEHEGMLYTVQRRMRVIIILAMALSIILFGMQVALGDNVINLKEISIFFLKLILVIYLTTTHTNKDGITDNGMAKYIGFIDTISSSLQAMVMHSVTKNGLCKAIETTEYKVNIPGQGEKNLEYLRVWDLLDCKFAFYFSSGFSNKIADASANAAFDPYDRPLFYQITAILNIPFRFIISYIALALFCLFLVFTVMQICELVICAFLAFSILVVVSPIFVPFILFKSQKQLFDSWVNQVLAYSLYPVLVFAFMGFLFISMDNLLFGSTYFVPTTSYIDGRKITSYAVDSSKDFSATEACAGFKISSSGIQEAGDIPKGCDCSGTHCMLNASVISSKPSGTFVGKTTGATLEVTQQGERTFMVGCLSLMFIMFIYYQLSKEIYSLLNALAGSMRSIIMHQTTTATQRMEGAGTIALGLLRSKPSNKKPSGPETSTGSNGAGLPGIGTGSGSGAGGIPNIGTEKTDGGSGGIPRIGTRK